MTVRDSARQTQARGGSALWAGALTMAESVVLIAFFAFYVYEMVSGASDDLARAGTSGGLILAFAIFLGVVGRAWLHGSGWPRTPTIVWNVLLLPVAWSLHEADRTAIALAVAALALATIVAAVAVGPAKEPGDFGDEVS